jgi:bifunctional non-homologous end joining protein LigD
MERAATLPVFAPVLRWKSRIGQADKACWGALPPDIPPMLAETGVPRSMDGWAAEPKLDGWRARVLVDGDELAVRTRRGRPITESVPSVAGLRGLSVVLDGELVAGAGTLADFYRLGSALAVRRRTGAEVSFVAFDLLWLDGETLTGRPYADRRKLLAGLKLPARGTPVVPSFDGLDAALLFKACDALGVEGVVLKRQASLYWPRERSRDWRKAKCQAWREHLERRMPNRW